MFKDALTVQVARQEFLAKGQVGQGLVAKEIERSWQRCLANGIDAESAQSYMLSKHEFGQRIEMNHLLLSHARPEMDTLNEQIAHTRSIVILTDAEGVILHSLGDSSFMTEAQRVALGPGSSWNERHRGTNAIGTALIEQSPMTVHGAEHYVAKHHVLSCSAVPIYGVQNDLIGTLDVSNDYLLPQQHTLALVKMAAQMIALLNICEAGDEIVAARTLPAAREQGYVDALLREHLDGAADRSEALWQVLCLELWAQRFV
ncbi:MAG: hypothetical protein CVU26_07850, partial [Betaproteobacteria bacterium HGW-Betaproteobacteria-2]